MKNEAHIQYSAEGFSVSALCTEKTEIPKAHFNSAEWQNMGDEKASIHATKESDAKTQIAFILEHLNLLLNKISLDEVAAIKVEVVVGTKILLEIAKLKALRYLIEQSVNKVFPGYNKNYPSISAQLQCKPMQINALKRNVLQCNTSQCNSMKFR